MGRDVAQSQSADDIIALLGLVPHPEGGHYRETFRDTAGVGGRAASTAIYFLLKAGEQSHWHTVDAVETWHHYAGATLLLETAAPDGEVVATALGSDIAKGERPQAVVPRSLATRAQSRCMDAGRMHGRARLHIRRLHTRSQGLHAGPLSPTEAHQQHLANNCRLSTIKAHARGTRW